MSHSGRRDFRLSSRNDTRIRADLDAELSLHIELRTEELIGTGMGRDAARREAEREFGDITFTRAYCEALDRAGEREWRWTTWFAELRNDVHWALRGIRRHPGYAALVVLTLALGVGANTAVFGVVKSVLLRSLPYADAGRLLAIDENNIPSGNKYSDVAAAEYLDWTTATRSLSGIAATSQRSVTYAEGPTPEQIAGRRVSANLFEVLGVTAAIGRVFQPGEDRGVHRVVVITDGLWRRLFGGDRSIIGRQVMFSGESYTVIGVLPENFLFPGSEPQVFIPIDFDAAMNDVIRARRFHFVHAFGRLRPGATNADALAELGTIARRAESEHPHESVGHLVSVRPLPSAMVGDVRPTMLVLAGAAAFVLLIACANIANLALTRAMARRRELAVRAALGAARGRVARQLLTESTVLAMIGGGAGAVIAYAGTPALIALYPRALPRGFTVHIDGGVFVFALVASAFCGIVFGLLPAFAAGREGVAPVLRDAARSATGGRSGASVRKTLVVVQVALAMVLLVGAGLLLRTLAQLQSVDLGFDPARLTAVSINLSGARYSSREGITGFWNALLDRVRKEPGFADASLVSAVPLMGASGAGLTIQGHETSGEPPGVMYGVAMDGSFKTMGVPIRAGRDFSIEDRASDAGLVIVTEAAARHFWPGGNPVGSNIRLGPDPSRPWARVIGVVGDVHVDAVDAPPAPMVIAYAQHDVWAGLSLLVRTTAAPTDVRATVARIVRELDPSLATQSAVALSDVVAQSSANRRFALSLVGAFALVALSVAIVGLYGVIAYGVAARRQEFAVRLALGATASRIVGIALKEGTVLAGIGIAVGLLGAAMLTRLLGGLLFGVRPLDPLTFVASVAGVSVAALAASLLPARAAANVDPSNTLRGG